tara:strand:- start:349 stop:618 length:270 start_codon:yes stop_codon:yes gene_type:complete
MGALVTSHVVNSVETSASSYELNIAPGVKVTHVAVSKVHESMALHLKFALWNHLFLNSTVIVLETHLNLTIHSLKGGGISSLQKIHERR